LALALAAVGVYSAYQNQAGWTGFVEFAPTPTPPGATPSPFGATPQVSGYKQLWDWMELLIVPLVLAIFGILFSQAQKNTEFALQEAKEDETAYHAFLDKMTELIINGKLLETDEDSPTRDLAKSRVLTAIQVLGDQRKRLVLNFLMGANLIRSEGGIIQMDGADFSGAEFQEISIIRATISGANFTGANLSRANLSDSDFSLSTFERANLTESVLAGTVLAGVILDRARLGLARIDGANFHKASLQRAYLVLARVERARFSEAKLAEADFTGAYLVEASFGGANLKGTSFIECDLRKAIFQFDLGAQAANQELKQKGLDSVSTETWIEKTRFFRADLREADFTCVDLTRARGLETARLQGVVLARANLTGIDLRGTDLTGAVLDEATVSRKYITDAQLATVKSKTGLVLVD
jgi:uncharacterized protein YjbI with pentapeptide repeats